MSRVASCSPYEETLNISYADSELCIEICDCRSKMGTPIVSVVHTFDRNHRTLGLFPGGRRNVLRRESNRSGGFAEGAYVGSGGRDCGCYATRLESRTSTP